MSRTMDVMPTLQGVGAFFTVDRYDDGLKELRDLWDRIPNPKTETLNSYMVVEYGVAFALKSGNLAEASRWAALAQGFQQVRQDMGEVEFLIGKVAFENGDLQTAKENFQIANTKSEGRSFIGEDKKYKNLIE